MEFKLLFIVYINGFVPLVQMQLLFSRLFLRQNGLETLLNVVPHLSYEQVFVLQLLHSLGGYVLAVRLLVVANLLYQQFIKPLLVLAGERVVLHQRVRLDVVGDGLIIRELIPAQLGNDRPEVPLALSS